MATPKKQPKNQPLNAVATVSGVSALPEKDIERIREEMKEQVKTKDSVFGATREFTREAKGIIYSIHRRQLPEAKKRLAKLHPQIGWLMGKARTRPQLWNMCQGAAEEYAEAACFYAVMAEEPFPDPKQLGIDSEAYLAGLCDLTGEIMREAVIEATKGNTAEVERLHAFTEDIMGKFIQLDLSNGELRKKADSIKWNLSKIEQVVYDIKMREHT